MAVLYSTGSPSDPQAVSSLQDGEDSMMELRVLAHRLKKSLQAVKRLRAHLRKSGAPMPEDASSPPATDGFPSSALEPVDGEGAYRTYYLSFALREQERRYLERHGADSLPALLTMAEDMLRACRSLARTPAASTGAGPEIPLDGLLETALDAVSSVGAVLGGMEEV